jgi:hypothetical protein
VIGVGVQAWLGWIYFVPEPKRLCGDEVLYMASARGLLAGDPGWPMDPLWPPLYPQVLAGAMAIGGGGAGGIRDVVCVVVLQTLLLAGCAVVLADLTRQLAGSDTAGWAAAALLLGFPPAAAYAQLLWPELLHLLLLLVVLWTLAVRWRSPGWSVLAGVALGLALLTKSLLQPFAPVLVLAGFAWRGRSCRVAMVRNAAAMVLATAITITPVLVMQHRRTGRVMIADSTAFNLWVGLNDTARRSFDDPVAARAWVDYMAGGDDFTSRVASLRQRLREHVAGRSLLAILGSQLGRQYFRLFDKDSFLTMQLAGGPQRAEGCGYAGGQASAGLLRGLSFAVYGLLLVLAPLGLALWRFRCPRWIAVLLGFGAYNLLLFLAFHVKARYRMQLLPVGLVGAGAAVAWLEAWLVVRLGTRAGSAGTALAQLRQPRQWWRYLVAAAAAAVLLALAFGRPLLDR